MEATLNIEESLPGLYIRDEEGQPKVVILVTDEDAYYYRGFCVQAEEETFKLGHYSRYWPKETFKRFVGSITLRNS
jgi:hypothetical protein